MKIQWMSQKEAEEINPNSSMAIISIVATGRTRNLKPGWGARKDLDFNSVSRIVPEEERISGYKVFDAAMAKELAGFVNTLPPEITSITVHCSQGLQRSAAIAKVLCEKYREPFPEDHPFFSALVYEEFRKALP